MTKVDEIDGPVLGVAWGGGMGSTYAHPISNQLMMHVNILKFYENRRG